MLAYHIAYDPYHAAFRLLRILVSDSAHTYETGKLRILDFYLAFPQLIRTIRVPRNLLSRKNRVARRTNPYQFTGNPRVVFRRMEAIQEIAVRLLASSGFISQSAITQGVVGWTGAELPPPLRDRVIEANREEADIVSFLVAELGQIPFHGSDGLKARSSLMEHRYDAV